MPEATEELLPARMLNEYVYCPRLFHLEYVGGEWRPSADTIDGDRIHKRVDRPSGNLREQDDEETGSVPSRDELLSVHLSSTTLGVTAVLDRVVRDGDRWVPVDTKKGKLPPDGRAWPADRMQVAIQALLLRAEGYECRNAAVYYAGSKRKVQFEVDELVEMSALRTIQEARACADQAVPPPPLEDSPKCKGCSLNPICLPDETRALADGPEAANLATVPPPTDDSRPLFVQDQGAKVGKSGDRLVVYPRNGSKVEVRMLDVSQLCLFGGVEITSGALKALADRGIPVCWFSTGGWFYGTMRGLGSKNAGLRLAQSGVALDEERSLHLARGIVSRKISNQRTLLSRNGRDVPRATLDGMKRLIDEALVATHAESLLGLEGLGAKLYFQSFAAMLRKEDAAGTFDFTRRNRRPPRDPVNALLSMAYATLTKDFTVALDAVGLDPYIGVFHRPGRGKPALALDVMEEFRPLIADSVVLQLVNNGEVGPQSFVQAGDRCNLTPAGRKKFYSAYRRRMDHELTHPIFGYKISYRQLLEIQSRLFGRAVTGELPGYDGFTTR